MSVPGPVASEAAGQGLALHSVPAAGDRQVAQRAGRPAPDHATAAAPRRVLGVVLLVAAGAVALWLALGWAISHTEAS